MGTRWVVHLDSEHQCDRISIMILICDIYLRIGLWVCSSQASGNPGPLQSHTKSRQLCILRWVGVRRHHPKRVFKLHERRTLNFPGCNSLYIFFFTCCYGICDQLTIMISICSRLRLARGTDCGRGRLIMMEMISFLLSFANDMYIVRKILQKKIFWDPLWCERDSGRLSCLSPISINKSSTPNGQVFCSTVSMLCVPFWQLYYSASILVPARSSFTSFICNFHSSSYSTPPSNLLSVITRVMDSPDERNFELADQNGLDLNGVQFSNRNSGYHSMLLEYDYSRD